MNSRFSAIKPALLGLGILVWIPLGTWCFGQDAVNPCEILSETLNCSGPGLHGAEIDFKTIKLNGKRKNDPMVSVGENLLISTAIKYKKRAKAEITTTFNGGCPVRTETKRLKPEVAITYSATLNGTPYSGSGGEFTVNAPLAIGSYPLVVTFTATAVNGCIDNAPLSETKTFVLDVIDGAFILGLDAVKSGTTTSVASGAYLCKGQGQELDLTVNFSDPLNTLPFGSNDIVWTVAPTDAGTFSGPSGANGQTVTWLQADDFVSAAEDDVVITVNAPDMQPRSYYLTVFGINSTSGVLAVNTTQTFPIEPSDVQPADATLSVIVSALSGNTDVGFGSATKLRTRTFTGSSPFNQLENEIFHPAEADQTIASLQIIKSATFQQGSNGLEVVIEAGPVAGDVNITWEQDRPGGTRKILHREHMTVTSGQATDTVTIYKLGTMLEGPFYEPKGYSVTLEAKTGSGSFEPNFPVWSITPSGGITITAPNPGIPTFPLSNLEPGEYTISAKIGETAQEKDTFNIYIYHADLDVDTNRKEGITDADDAGEDAWSSSGGAIVAVNYDDDDGNDNGKKSDSISFTERGYPTGEDFKINPGVDFLDTAPLLINPVGSVTGLQYFLRADASDLKAIHIFEARTPDAKVLKDHNGDHWSGWETHESQSGLKAVEITDLVLKHGPLNLAIESLFFPGQRIYPNAYVFPDPEEWDEHGYQYDGEIELELVVQTDTGNPTIDNGSILATDKVKLRTAPFLLLPNTQDAIAVYMDNLTGANDMAGGFDLTALNKGNRARRVDPTTDSVWFQDHVQIGYTFSSYGLNWVTLRMPYQDGDDNAPTWQDDWPEDALLKDSMGLFRIRNIKKLDGTGSSGDFGGNLELVPFSDEYPLGRIIYGSNMHEYVKEFFKNQTSDGTKIVQDPFEIDVDWLHVGHVDEVVSFVKGGSRGYKVAHASPDLGKTILENGVPAKSIPETEDFHPFFALGAFDHGVASNSWATDDGLFLFDGASHGRITCVAKGQIDDGKTIVLDDGMLSRTYEFNKSGMVASGNVEVDISSANTAKKVRDELLAAMKADASSSGLKFVFHEDSTNKVIVISSEVGPDTGKSITTDEASLTIIDLAGGEPLPTTPTDDPSTHGKDVVNGTSWKVLRLYDGQGQGQVAILDPANVGRGWVKLDDSNNSVSFTTSRVLNDVGGGEVGVHKFSSRNNTITKTTHWNPQPSNGTKYIISENSHVWRHKTGIFPALWSYGELRVDSKLWTFNDRAQDYVDTAVNEIISKMGKEDSTTTDYIRTDNDPLNDSLPATNSDDVIAMPVIYYGEYDDTSSATDVIVSGKAGAFTPNPVNLQPVTANRIVIPYCFTPAIAPGNGGPIGVFFHMVSHIIDGNNNRAWWVDVWDNYHRNEGEVHCGTAAQRKWVTKKWWSDSP